MNMIREKANETKRYNLVLPQVLYDELEAVADRKKITTVELLRRFIKLGMLTIAVEDKPDTKLIIREGKKERQIIFV